MGDHKKPICKRGHLMDTANSKFDQFGYRHCYRCALTRNSRSKKAGRNWKRLVILAEFLMTLPGFKKDQNDKLPSRR